LARPVSYFFTRPRTAPDWIIPGWLKRRNTGFILGQPKRACKSWLLLNMAWQLSEGRPLWGIHKARGEPLFQPSRPMRVVYFSQEDTDDDIQDRIELLASAGWKPNDRFWVVPKDLKLSFDEPGKAMIHAHLNQVREVGPIDLILFDPMRRMHYGKENDSETIANIWKTLDALHERYDCGTIFSHHVVKPPRDTTGSYDPTSPYAARGSGDIYGGGDAFINVIPKTQRGRGTAKRDLDLHFETKRSRAISPVTLSVSFETGEVSFVSFLLGREKSDVPSALDNP